MAPHELNEIRDIIEMVHQPLMRELDRALAGQDDMRKMIDHLSNQQAKLEERVVTAEKDVGDLYTAMENIKKTILEHQQKKFKQTIAVQGAILLLILGAFLSYIVPAILQMIHK